MPSLFPKDGAHSSGSRCSSPIRFWQGTDSPLPNGRCTTGPPSPRPVTRTSGFTIWESSPAGSWRRISVDGRAFRGDTRHLVALVPLQAGEKTVGPAEFQVQVNTLEPVGVSLGSREATSRARGMGEWTPVTLRSDPISVEVVPLPAEGRPESFRGHVGRVAVVSWLDRTEAEVGDTVALRVVMTGNAYLRLMPHPEIIPPEGFEIFRAGGQRRPPAAPGRPARGTHAGLPAGADAGRQLPDPGGRGVVVRSRDGGIRSDSCRAP